MLSIRTEPYDRKSIVVPTYEWVGEEVSGALLGAFYGKLVQNMGHLQFCGNFSIPSEVSNHAHDKERTPFNSEQRRPNGPPLNLSEAIAVIESYIAAHGKEKTGWLLRAAECYRVALESFYTRPELVLAMFCSTLESLLSIRDYSEDELVYRLSDPCSSGLLTIVRKATGLFVRLSHASFRSVKVAALVEAYLPESYFEQPESDVAWGVPKNRQDVISRVKAVYDLRSKVLHTGNRQGLWFLEHDHQRAEIGLGKPVLDNKELQKTLANCLTLTGMERVTSTVLRAVIAEWLDQQRPAANEQP